MKHSRRSWRICIERKSEGGLQWPQRCSRLSLILEAYTGVSDDEVIEATVMDRRWQLVLDCVDTEEAPFSKGTLVAFRQRLIEGQMDRRLIERTIEPGPARAGGLDHGHYVLHWIAAHYGEQDESRIRTIW